MTYESSGTVFSHGIWDLQCLDIIRSAKGQRCVKNKRPHHLGDNKRRVDGNDDNDADTKTNPASEKPRWHVPRHIKTIREMS